MIKRLTDSLIEYLKQAQGKIVYLKDIRVALNIEPGSKDDSNLRTQMSTTLVNNKIVSPSGKHDGAYRVIKPVYPVPLFSVQRENHPPFILRFPTIYDTDMELDFAEDIVIREGDLITIGGVKSKGKTQLCLSFCAENIEKRPILMGNEYTTMIDGVYEPTPRFYNRLQKMRNGTDWVDDKGRDKITLLPVRADYAEHIIRDRINIIDWINIDAGALYDIGKVLEGIKSNLGRGIGIVALQKGEGAINPRGGQFVRDFSDLEILLDGFGKKDDDILLTIKGCKEKRKPIVGKTYAYMIGHNGTAILDFREVEKCKKCYGKGYTSKGACEECLERGYVNA